MKPKNKTLLFLIVAIGFLLRVCFLDKYPPSPNWDEVSHGYNAYSILKTGYDEWGEFLPLSNFRAYGDYPLALNLYLTIPFIRLLGLNVFAIRLPHAILGTLTIIVSYYLVLGLTKSKRISLLSALLIAIEPWSFFLSRFVIQANLSIFFLILAFALFFNREKNRYFLPLSCLAFGLTLFSYHTTRIITPILLLIIFAVFRKEIHDAFVGNIKAKLLALFILLLFVIPSLFVLFKPESRARSSEVFIIDQGAINIIEQKRNSSSYPEIINRIIYNRPLFFITEAFKNYVGYFSPKFLFLKGGTQYQFSIPNRGLLYAVNLPFFYYGLYIVFKKACKKDKKYIFLILWLFASPIAASITKEDYAVLRSTPMLPLPQLFSALGIFSIYDILKKKQFNPLKYLVWVYLVLLVYCMGSYLSDYFNNYPRKYSQDWQYGYKEVVNYVMLNYDIYDKIIVTKKYGEPHEFFLFYLKWDPDKYRNDPNLIRFYQSNWYWVDRFDKFYFVNDWEIPKEGYSFVMESGGEINCTFPVRCLLITSPGNIPSGWNSLDVIKFIDNNPAFRIYDNSFTDIGFKIK